MSETPVRLKPFYRVECACCGNFLAFVYGAHPVPDLCCEDCRPEVEQQERKKEILAQQYRAALSPMEPPQ